MKTYNEFIENLTKQFEEGLEKKGLKWFQDWDYCLDQINGKTLKEYQGVNALALSLNGFTDSRYFTFLQAQEKGYKVKKGSKGNTVIKFSYWDRLTKQPISFKEYQEKVNDPTQDVTMFTKFYTVFNAEQLEGIELEERAKPKNYDTSLIDEIGEKMNVEIVKGSPYQSPCYVPIEDKVYLPNIDMFKSQSGLLATALHELSHANASRVGRSQEGRRKGSTKEREAYAYEELIAEISATILCNYWSIEKKVDDNHIAYIQSWLSALKSDKKYFVSAFKEAEKSANYIINLIEGEKANA